MSEPKAELSKEEQEKIERFEQIRKKKNKECANVLSFLVNTVGLKQHKSIFMQRSSIEYFRGVNFHVSVLANQSQILGLIPSLVEDGQVKQLKSIEDSINLGNMMVQFGNLIQLRADPRLIQQGSEKTPKYVIPERKGSPMTDKGIYMIIEENSKSTQSFYLILVVIVVLALMCFRLWPMWLKKGIWYISFYLLVFLIVTAILRLILWGVLYHFGLEFWLFPNYFIDSNDPRDSFLPVYSFEVREDFADARSIIFRLISGSLIVYMCFQFAQDEKNIEDLKDLAENGLTDLFEYGQDFMIGNALGDGKPKEGANDTRNDDQPETFADKYRKELKKDVDELGLDEEDEDLTNYDSENQEEEAKKEEQEEAVDGKDEEEFVSSKDMFDEM